MANIAEITIENTVKESRQIINNNFANLNEGLSTVAIDVSAIQSKLSTMLTTDNHLLLPSGLEVW